MSGQSSSEYIADCLAGRATKAYPFLAALGELIAIRCLLAAGKYGVDIEARLEKAVMDVRQAAREELYTE